MSDDIRKFEVDAEEYEKLVDAKILQFREILAPEKHGEVFEKVVADPDAVPEAVMNRIVCDMYAGQEALFASAVANIGVLISAGLIPKDKGAACYVLAKFLENKIAEALEAGMNAVDEELAEAQAEEERLSKFSVIKGGKDDTVH